MWHKHLCRYPSTFADPFHSWQAQQGVGMLPLPIRCHPEQRSGQNRSALPHQKNDLLSDVSGIPAAEIGEMEFGTTPNMIWDIVGNEKNCGFFKVVSKSF